MMMDIRSMCPERTIYARFVRRLRHGPGLADSAEVCATNSVPVCAAGYVTAPPFGLMIWPVM